MHAAYCMIFINYCTSIWYYDIFYILYHHLQYPSCPYNVTVFELVYSCLFIPTGADMSITCRKRSSLVRLVCRINENVAEAKWRSGYDVISEAPGFIFDRTCGQINVITGSEFLAAESPVFLSAKTSKTNSKIVWSMLERFWRSLEANTCTTKRLSHNNL